MDFTLEGWVLADGKGAPLGAAKVCRRRGLTAGPLLGASLLPMEEEVLDWKGVQVLEERFGPRPVCW